jgi:hypothetical protein
VRAGAPYSFALFRYLRPPTLLPVLTLKLHNGFTSQFVRILNRTRDAHTGTNIWTGCNPGCGVGLNARAQRGAKDLHFVVISQIHELRLAYCER